MITTLGISSRLHHCPGLETGQTTVYVTGDNGTYQTGRSKEYAILTTGQYSGTTAIVLNGKTDNHSNNCVQDLRRMLMWSRYVSASVGPTSNGLLPWTTNGNGEGVFTYVATANSVAVGGWSDWRIPNIFELYSLMDFEAPSSAPDSTAFPSWPTSNSVWTNTTVTVSSSLAYLEIFSYGETNNSTKITNVYVALVRGGY